MGELEKIYSSKGRLFSKGCIIKGSKQEVTKVASLYKGKAKHEHVPIHLNSDNVQIFILTLKAPITTAAEDIHK